MSPACVNHVKTMCMFRKRVQKCVEHVPNMLLNMCRTCVGILCVANVSEIHWKCDRNRWELDKKRWDKKSPGLPNIFFLGWFSLSFASGWRILQLWASDSTAAWRDLPWIKWWRKLKASKVSLLPKSMFNPKYGLYRMEKEFQSKRSSKL